MLVPKFLLVTTCFALANSQSYRLPRDVIPEQYYLNIITHLGEKDNFSFDGTVTIEVACLKPTTNITLHSKDLEIHEADTGVKDISSQEKDIKVTGIVYDKENDFIKIVVAEPLVVDHKYKFFISFKGKLNDGLAGFYRSSYKDSKTKETKWLGVTQFEPTSARRAFPCFDEPAMKARFQISIARHKGYSAISNMPLIKSESMKDKDGWFWDRFENSVPMSTYLVAYMVSDFGHKTSEPGASNVTFNIWARKDALSQVNFASQIGPKLLEFYEKYFDVKYPLPKQDMAAIPDFSSGAMENWGLITYREAYLLYDPQQSSSTSQHNVASVIAHELAHQWFGNLVTMKWWTDLWLNEGFATYMAGIATDHLFPKWNSLTEESASNLLRVFSFDGLKSSHPVSVPIGHPDEIDEIFDTISYKKGSFLIRMMSLFLGEEVLRGGVSDYLKKHKYGNAEQDDLWEALTIRAQQAGVLPKELTVKKIMDSWTVQTGYPLVTVTRNYGEKTAKVTQKRFLRDAFVKNSEQNNCWWVPLSYTTAKEANFNVTTPKKWFACPNEKEQIIENTGDDDDWLIVNIRSAGLYRVNYDEKNWQLISKKLQSESYKDISVLNRVQLIDDTSDLASVGDLKYNIFFDLLQYLEYENEYIPWKAALSSIGFLRKQLRGSPGYGYLETFMKQILTPIYNKIGGFQVKKATSDRLDSVKHQVLITNWACNFEVGECVNEAQKLFQEWRANPDKPNPIPKDFRSTVYCNAMKRGNQEDWDYLWRHYLSSNIATEKNTILSALGCTKQLWILNRYLQWSLDGHSGIRRQDMNAVFSTVVVGELGYYVAKEWFYENFQQILKQLSPNSRRISRYLSSISSRIITKRDFEEFQRFVEEHKGSLTEVRQGLEQSLETAKLNVQWQERHKDEMANLLEKHIRKLK